MEQRRSTIQASKLSMLQLSQHQRVAKSISNLLHNPTKKEPTYTKKHLERFLYTFSFEVGTDLPSDETLRNIYMLLVGAEDNRKDGIKEEYFNKLVEVCTGLYKESKKTAIGGIFERVVMGLKQSLYYSKLEAVAEQAV